MWSKSIRGAVWFSVMLLLAPLAFAGGTGNLKIVTKDADGLPMPGVMVTIQSPAMMGTKTLISDPTGVSRFTRLVPAVYEVDATLEGFGTASVPDARVSLETTNTIELTLQPAMGEVITVTSQRPLIDTSTPTIREHVQLETVEALPIGRDYVAYMQLVSGVNMVANAQGVDTPEDPAGKGGLNYSDRGGQGALISKSGSRDNVYYLDGVNITGMETQTSVLTFNNEVIQEQEIISSGVPAEYSGGKGIVANIVTKSGGDNVQGSANFYFQSQALVQADDPFIDDRTFAPVDSKYDTAATVGGPALKEKIWYFGSVQRVKFTNDVELSSTATATPGETVPYDQGRTNLFGKLTAMPTEKDQFIISGFWGDLDTEGSRSVNVLPDRRYLRLTDGAVFSAFYQRLFSADLILDARYGHYQYGDKAKPINPAAGQQNTVLYDPAEEIPAYDRLFGGASSVWDDVNKRDYIESSMEYYTGGHRIKGGFNWTFEQDSDAAMYPDGSVLTSLAFNLGDRNLGELTEMGLYSPSEVETQIMPSLNNNWSETSAAVDTNNDGVVSLEETYAVTFGAANDHGLNYQRIADTSVGTNNVRANRWSLFVQDDFKISQNLTLNGGLRLSHNTYVDSNDQDIVSIPTAWLPRVGGAWDMNGDGRRKLSAFYGQYLDDIPMGMVHFAGNRSGRVRDEQIWLNNDWYTFRERGSADTLDSLFTPNVEDPRAHELNVSFGNDFGDGIYLTAQGYWRKDTNLLEDYDLPLYLEIAPNDPNFSDLALTPEDFGYPNAAAIPENVNYYQTNLIGGQRKYWGMDFDLRKRFVDGHMAAFQYSWKDGRSNSQSDGNADLQGDVYQIDPRNDWMYGTMPGNINHKIKAFGTYRTKLGLDVSGLFYWNNGWTYTESYVFQPGQYDIYLNNPAPGEPWYGATDYIQTGTMRNPAWWQIDLKFGYRYQFSQYADAQFFLDIYNIFNQQSFIHQEAGVNDQEFGYQDATGKLTPRRLYMGARVNF